MSSVEDIRASLQNAIELEFFTIPPYLSALYSLHDNRNESARNVIQSIVMEEMLHMLLITNVLNAIGGKPVIDPNGCANGVLKRGAYPAKIPHISNDLTVSLLPFGIDAIKMFMEIEAPEKAEGCDSDGRFTTIGEFYRDICNRLVVACEKYGEETVFSGERSLQYRRKVAYYGAGGDVTAVYCLHDALQAIAQVMEQGEGRLESSSLSGNAARFGQPREVAHYFRFKQIAKLRHYQSENNIHHDPQGERFDVDWDAIYPMQPNPKLPANPSEVQASFVQSYARLLSQLELGLQGSHEAIEKSITHMHALGHSARSLMKEKTATSDAETLGAPFWFVLSS